MQNILQSKIGMREGYAETATAARRRPQTGGEEPAKIDYQLSVLADPGFFRT